MRTTFLRTLEELAERDPRVMLLTGDLGYLVIESFAQRFPDRFFNVGVAEQNMIGLATGLAEAGFIPFVYSIATFAALRPYEFIRNGPILHGLPVRIVGVGGGVEYGHNGITHYGLEDVGVMRVQPGITVVAPADYEQTRTALCQTWNLPGPVYYRLGKDERTTIPGLDGRFEPGRIQQTRTGTDVAMIALGNVASEAATAAVLLEEQGISCSVAIVAMPNPAPTDDLVALLRDVPLAITVEAHYITGGVGSLVSEVVAEHGLRCRVVRCGFHTMPAGISGSQDYLYERYGLSAAALVETTIRELQNFTL